MKLHCNVEIFDRTFLSKRNSKRSILALFKKSSKCDDIYLYLQTRQNVQGTMYQIINNINHVFRRFITDGRATIRLIKPSHDLIIQSDTIQLKSFLHILGRIMSGPYENIDKHTLTYTTNFNTKDFFPLQKQKVVVKKKSEYPTLQGFPKTTEELILSGLARVSFDRQILTLQSLKTLDLSRNKISFLPKELGTLPRLQHLYMAENLLGTSTRSKWAWLEQTTIQNNLLSLDISSNNLHELLPQIGKLNSLTTLKVSQNMLEELPQSIGNLQHLTYLDVAKNDLSCLPGTIVNLKLQFLDITYNQNFKFHQVGINYCIQTAEGLPSLFECSARSIIKSRLKYETLVPLPLVRYLDEAKYCCFCKNACFNHYFRYCVYFFKSRISDIMKTPILGCIGTDCYFCSSECVRYTINNNRSYDVVSTYNVIQCE